MAESAKRRSCFHQSLNLDGLGFSWQPFWWLRCNYCEDQATVVIVSILIKFFDTGVGRPSSRRRWGSTTSNVALETRGRRWGSLSCQTWSRWPCWCWFRWWSYDDVGYWGVCQVQCRRKTCLTKVPAMIQPLLYWLAECTPVTRLKCKSFWAPETSVLLTVFECLRSNIPRSI